jgi:DNA-binding response OmpR family regulator
VPLEEVPQSGAMADAGPDRPIVLVVDDEPSIADAVTEILNKNGYVAIPAYDAEDAIETALLVPPELVIAAVGLQGKSGKEMAAILKTKLPDCKVLLLAEPEAAAKQIASAGVVFEGAG